MVFYLVLSPERLVLYVLIEHSLLNLFFSVKFILSSLSLDFSFYTLLSNLKFDDPQWYISATKTFSTWEDKFYYGRHLCVTLYTFQWKENSSSIYPIIIQPYTHSSLIQHFPRLLFGMHNKKLWKSPLAQISSIACNTTVIKIRCCVSTLNILGNSGDE